MIRGAYLAIKLLCEHRHLLDHQPWCQLGEFHHKGRDRLGASGVVAVELLVAELSQYFFTKLRVVVLL